MSKSIQELREALQRQAQETMKLQEEATKFSADSMSRREGASSPSTMANPSLSASFTSSRNPPYPSTRSAAMESSVCSADAVAGSPPKMYSNHELDVESQKKPPKYTGNEPTETILKEYSQQVRNLQKRLSESTEQHEQQTFTLRQTIIELQTSLRDAIKEKDSIMDLRRRESQTQEDFNCKMKTSLSDLQTANQIQEEMLKEANNQIEHLKMMLQGHDNVLQEFQNVLTIYEKNSGKKIYEPESVSSLHVYSLPTALSKLLQELEAIVSHLRGRVALLEEQLEIVEKESQSKTETLLQQHQESLERLIGEHERELEALSENVSASHSHARSVQSQMEIIQEQAKNQSSLYTRQISQLESTVSQLRSELREARRMSQDKIEDLEKQLHLARSEIAETQSERDQYSQETGNLDDQVQHLMAELHKKELELSLETEQNKRLWDRDTGSSITIDHLRRELDNKNMELQRMDSLVKSMKTECEEQMERQMSAIREKNESVEKVTSLAALQESTKDTLRKVMEELAEKKTRLETAERQVAELTSCLQEKEKVIESTNAEIEKLHGRVDSKLEELQQLKKESEHLRSMQSECESLKLQLTEKEKVIEILQKQIENMTQIVDQHGRAVGAMETEKSHLLKEVNEKKLEVHELKILQDKKDSEIRELEASLSEMELERVKLMNANSEKLRVIKEMTLEREELVTEVRAGRIELATLAEESEAIRTDYREKTEEMEAMVNKLKLQLKSAQIDLEQTRGTLKTMEGSDGHAMKVAMGMQKQITAKRGQIDALQSKIQFLEDAMASATKEKHYLKEERNKLCRELSCLAALNNKMSGELEILKAQDKRLKEKLATVEAALDKASMQFAECQCIMQQQEQEVMRCKLQHKLDVKELQGPGYALGITSLKPRYSTLPYSHPSSASASQSFAGHISQVSSRSSSTKEDPLRDLKLLLQELRSTVDEIPSVILTDRESDHDTDSVLEGASSLFDRTSRECIGRRAHETYSREAAVRDLPSDGITRQDTFGREPSTLHSADLEDHDSTLSFTSSVPQAIFSSTPRYTSSKKLSPEERSQGRSPVHSLLTSSPDDLKATSAPSSERRSSLKKSCSPEAATSSSARNVSFSASSFMHTEEANGNTCRKLQNKMESLQNRVETMQLKNQAMSTMIRCQEKKIEQAKEKEKKLSK